MVDQVHGMVAVWSFIRYMGWSQSGRLSGTWDGHSLVVYQVHGMVAVWSFIRYMGWSQSGRLSGTWDGHSLVYRVHGISK